MKTCLFLPFASINSYAHQDVDEFVKALVARRSSQGPFFMSNLLFVKVACDDPPSFAPLSNKTLVGYKEQK